MNQYTHVILDEVHERDQDSDFCLLVVRRMLRTNSRDVKVAPRVWKECFIDFTMYTYILVYLLVGLFDISYIPRRKSGIYWIQVRRAAAAAAVEISLWTR